MLLSQYRAVPPYQPGTQLRDNDLCNGFTIDAVVPGVEVNIKGETGPACQAEIECGSNWGLNFPGERSFAQVACYAGTVGQ